jgi:hypothetical protein
MTEASLQKFFRLRRADSARKGWRCPPPTTVAAYVDGRLEGPSHLRVERHLADCSHCLNEVGLLVHAQELGQTDQPSSEVLAHVRSLGDRKVGNSLTPAWGWAAASACAAMIAFLAVRALLIPGAISPMSPPDTALSDALQAPSARNVPEARSAPELINPREGALLSRKNLNFKWRTVTGTRDYDILIVTAEGNLVWQGHTAEPHIQIPDEVPLAARQPYFVWVRAQLPEGKALRSTAVSFRIEND